jgi:hypothetical protein
VVVPIASANREGHSLEGTRLTMVKVPQQPDAYEFSIRTPVTPSRWEDFDKELDLAWEEMLACLVTVGACGGAVCGAVWRCVALCGAVCGAVWRCGVVALCDEAPCCW